MTRSEDDALWRELREVEACLVNDELDAARAATDRAAELAGADHPEVLYARACLTIHSRGVQAAVPLLERVVETDSDHADALYTLAQAAEERGEPAEMIELFLRVQTLDARSDRAARVGTASQLERAEQTASRVIAGLPAPFAERLAHVPVILERRPARALVREGFDPRALGLFEGPIHGDSETPAPTRIVLFVNNLLADYPTDPELSEQIEITLLHEIGHYFGLDEDDMVRLGLH